MLKHSIEKLLDNSIISVAIFRQVTVKWLNLYKAAISSAIWAGLTQN